MRIHPVTGVQHRRTAAVPSQAGPTVSIADSSEGTFPAARARNLLFGYTCRASVAYLAMHAGKSIRALTQGFSRLGRRCRAPGVHEIAHQVVVGAGPVRLRRAGRGCREDGS
jgi:hypothetical protein